MPVNTGPAAAELDEDFTELEATDDFEELEATEALELDATEALELDATDATELAELVAVPHVEAVNCALFLPTPATCASLSLTHCAVTGE